MRNNSVDVTVRIPSAYSDGTRDAKRLERTKHAGPFRRGWLNLTDRTPARIRKCYYQLTIIPHRLEII